MDASQNTVSDSPWRDGFPDIATLMGGAGHGVLATSTLQANRAENAIPRSRWSA